MSIDKSLKRKNQLVRQRSVLTRAERIKTMQEQEKWVEGRSPFGLPKVRVIKHVVKKAKKEKVAEGAEGAAAPGAEGAAAPAAAAPAAEKKAGGDKKAEKK
jgi:small basic protein (TIGR04137 family)